MEALATLAALLDRTINEVKDLEGDLQIRVRRPFRRRKNPFRAETARAT